MCSMQLDVFSADSNDDSWPSQAKETVSTLRLRLQFERMDIGPKPQWLAVSLFKPCGRVRGFGRSVPPVGSLVSP